MAALCSNELKLYSTIKEIPVDWLWYPYIPYGKITLLQGDPGGGKSTLMMNIISAVSTGGTLPDGANIKKPMHVIYQCSEDGAADTIKPRLIKAGADCQNIAFFDEEIETLTLADDAFRRAIADFNAKLLVIDPFQAYLGDADLSNAMSIRKTLRRLGLWASAYDCAIVLIGHLNKKQGTKDLYRGLGSIDLVAAARSVIQVSKDESDPDIRVLRHIKSSLAPTGKDLFFRMDSRTGMQWLDSGETAPQPSDATETIDDSILKREQICNLLKAMLADGPRRAVDIRAYMKDEGMSERTLMLTKKLLGITSVRKNGVWYWQWLRSADDSHRRDKDAE